MCLTCGCGQPHKDMGQENISYDDIKRAADANSMSVAETLSKIQKAAEVERSESRQTHAQR